MEVKELVLTILQIANEEIKATAEEAIKEAIIPYLGDAECYKALLRDMGNVLNGANHEIGRLKKRKIKDYLTAGVIGCAIGIIAGFIVGGLK